MLALRNQSSVHSSQLRRVSLLLTRLVTLPLWWGSVHSGSNLLRQVSRKLGGDLGKGRLVGAHLDSKLLEVGELVGETDGVTVNEHEVAGLVTDLVDLEDTLGGHGSLELVNKVLSEAEWPPLATGVGGLDKLVHHTVDLGDLVVDLDLIGGEDGWDSGGGGETLGCNWLDSGERGNGVEEVTEGREVLALTLGGVISELLARGDSVGLEGEVVIGNGAVVTLDGLEGLVGVLLNGVGDLDEHVLLDAGKVGTGSVLNLLSAGLTDLDGLGDLTLHIGTHGLVLLADELAVGRGLLDILADNAGEHLKTLLDLLVVGGDGGSEGGKTVTEVLLGGGDASLGVGVVLGDGSGMLAVLLNVGLLDGGHVGVKLLGGIGEVLAGVLVVGGHLGADGGDLAPEESVELLELLGGGTLVLVENLTERTTSLDRVGLLGVHEGLDALELTCDVTVDLDLGGLVGDDDARDDLDIAGEAGVHLLDSGGHGGEAGGELLTGLDDLVGSLLAGGGDVLDGGGETSVSEGSLLSDSIVHAGDGGGELGVELSTVLGHGLVDLTELVGGLLLGLG